MSITVTLNRVNDLTNTNTAQQTINSNSDAITEGFVDALNVTGDQMEGVLDMNSNRIINLPKPVSGAEPARLQDITSTSIPVALPTLTGAVTSTTTSGTINTVFSGTGNLPMSQLAGGSGASNATFLRGDGVWASPGSASITAGANIAVTGTSPTVVSLPVVFSNYTQIQGQGATGSGSEILLGNNTDNAIYFIGTNFQWKNGTATGSSQAVANLTNGVLKLGVVSSVDGAVVLARQTGTSAVTIQASQTSTAYTMNLPTSLGATGALLVSGGTGSPMAFVAAATTSNQMYLSSATASPVLSTSVWPVDVSTNQILVGVANHTWAATSTVTNLSLTTPTLVTATMTGTTAMANATMSGALTFSTGAIGIAGITDTSTSTAGIVGEYKETGFGAVSAQSLFSGTSSSIMGLVLTPGDWDVNLQASFLLNNATSTIGYTLASINSTAVFNAAPGAFADFLYQPGTFSNLGSTVCSQFVGPFRININSTSTYFNVVICAFSGSVSAYGFMRARRMR